MIDELLLPEGSELLNSQTSASFSYPSHAKLATSALIRRIHTFPALFRVLGGGILGSAKFRGRARSPPPSSLP